MDREVGRSQVEGFEEFIVKEGSSLEEPGELLRSGLSAEQTSELNMGVVPLKYDKVFYAQDFALICFVDGKRLRVDILPLEGFAGKELPFLEPEILFAANIAKEMVFLKYKTNDRLICSLVVPLVTGTVCQIFLDEEGFIFSKRRAPMIVEFNLRRAEELEAAGSWLKAIEELSVKCLEVEGQARLVVAAVFEDDRIHLFELPLECSPQTDYYQKAVEVEGVELSLERPGVFQTLSSFTSSIFSSGQKQAPARPTLESIRYIGKYLMCVIENYDGDFEAKLVNVASSETIARRRLPFITSEFEYQIGSIDLDPASVRPDTVAVSLVFAAVFKDKTRIWNLYTSPNSEVLIWKLCFRAPEGKVRFSDIGVDDANHFSSARSLVEAGCESLHFPSSVVAGLSLSNDHLVLHTYNIVEFRNEVFCYQLGLVGYNRMCVYTRDDMLTVLLLEDFTASAWAMGLDLTAYLRRRLFQSARFSVEVLRHVLVAYFESCSKIARGRLGSLACVRRVDELEEALDAVAAEHPGVAVDYMKLIRESTALELSSIISHFGLDPDCQHPPIVVRENRSVSLLLKTSGYSNLRNTVSFIHYKKFVRLNVQHYLSLREPTLYIRNNYSTDIVEKVAERVKNIERNHLKVDFGIEPAVTDFHAGPEHQAFLRYLLQLRSLLTEAGDLQCFFEVHWAVLAVMAASAAQTPASTKNIKATLTFIFDLLLTKVSLVETDLLRQTYLNESELIDAKMSYLVSDYFEHHKSGERLLPTGQQPEQRCPLTENFVQAAALSLGSSLAATSGHFLLVLFHKHVNRQLRDEDPLVEHLAVTTATDLSLQRLSDGKELVRLVSAVGSPGGPGRRNLQGLDALRAACLEHLYSQPVANLSLLYFAHRKAPARWLEFSRLLNRSGPELAYCNGLALVQQGPGSFAQAQREFFRCAASLSRWEPQTDEASAAAAFGRGPWVRLGGGQGSREAPAGVVGRDGELWLRLFGQLEGEQPGFLAFVARAVCEQPQTHIEVQKLYYRALVEHSVRRAEPRLAVCPPPQHEERRLFEYLAQSLAPALLPQLTPLLVLHADYSLLRAAILRSVRPDLGNLHRTRDAALALFRGDFLRRDFAQVRLAHQCFAGQLTVFLRLADHWAKFRAAFNFQHRREVLQELGALSNLLVALLEHFDEEGKTHLLNCFHREAARQLKETDLAGFLRSVGFEAGEAPVLTWLALGALSETLGLYLEHFDRLPNVDVSPKTLLALALQQQPVGEAVPRCLGLCEQAASLRPTLLLVLAHKLYQEDLCDPAQDAAYQAILLLCRRMDSPDALLKLTFLDYLLAKGKDLQALRTCQDFTRLLLEEAPLEFAHRLLDFGHAEEAVRTLGRVLDLNRQLALQFASSSADDSKLKSGIFLDPQAASKFYLRALQSPGLDGALGARLDRLLEKLERSNNFETDYNSEEEDFEQTN